MYSPFTDEVRRAFQTALDEQRPEPPDEAAFIAAPQVVSLASGAADVGIAIRFRLQTGNADTVLTFNPVAARHLVVAILTLGQEQGWIDAAGDLVTSPTYRA